MQATIVSWFKTVKARLFRRIPVLSIRASLSVLVVGCILPISAVAAFLTVNFYTHQREQLTITSISRARAMMAAVDRSFASTQAALQALSTSHRLATGDLSGFHARAKEALSNLPVDNIVVLARDGQLLMSTGRPFGTIFPKLATPPALQHTLKTGTPGVSGLFRESLTGRLVFTISVPVKPNKSNVYSLNAMVSPAQLLELVSEQKLPNGWIGAIIDSNGCIVGRTHNLEKFVGKKVTQSMWQQINTSYEGGFATRTLDNVPAFTVYSRSAVTKWTVALAMPLAQINEGLHHTLIFLLIATFAALLLGLALAWFIGGRIAGSVTALISPAIALGSEKPFTIPKLHFAEANELRRALINASVTLHQAQYDAYHDGLTDLPNRAFFHNVLNQQLSLCRRNNTELAVLYIDLDGFKQVNDSYGHAHGDELLRTVSTRIKNAIRASDIAARLGGDEFAIALIYSNLENATLFARKLIEIISAPYQIDTNKVIISASIGVAGYPLSAMEGDTLLKNADHAMYNAKALGKRRVCVAPN